MSQQNQDEMNIDKPTEENTQEVEKAPEKINIKVVDSDGSEIFFMIKTTTSLQKLINAYCKRQGITKGVARFIFDGNRIGPEDTPETLDIQDGDAIDVMIEQTGGRFSNWYPSFLDF